MGEEEDCQCQGERVAGRGCSPPRAPDLIAADLHWFVRKALAPEAHVFQRVEVLRGVDISGEWENKGAERKGGLKEKGS